MTKQISIVLEIDDSIDEVDIIKEAKKFFVNLRIVTITGIHTKLIRDYGNNKNY